MRRSRVRGLSKLRRKLRRFPQGAQDLVRAEVELAADLVLAEAKGRVISRRVRDNLSIRLGRDGFSAEIGLRGKRARRRAWFAHFIEFGTAPHALTSRRGAAGKAGKGGGGMHPGTPARPFLFPALEANRARFYRRVEIAINRAIDIAAK
jgi:hypothetical protein